MPSTADSDQREFYNAPPGVMRTILLRMDFRAAGICLVEGSPGLTCNDGCFGELGPLAGTYGSNIPNSSNPQSTTTKVRKISKLTNESVFRFRVLRG